MCGSLLAQRRGYGGVLDLKEERIQRAPVSAHNLHIIGSEQAFVNIGHHVDAAVRYHFPSLGVASLQALEAMFGRAAQPDAVNGPDIPVVLGKLQDIAAIALGLHVAAGERENTHRGIGPDERGIAFGRDAEESARKINDDRHCRMRLGST